MVLRNNGIDIGNSNGNDSCNYRLIGIILMKVMITVIVMLIMNTNSLFHDNELNDNINVGN